ncbi:MAG: sulfatase-like hydrolase/transferase [Puniceicoccales bacterium]|jgi:phosphoglycerol transferase MdoB-like AlkP superfamily enzyme|nr:sulfatase-like hydrolase/transferase [Puniceicoccales bacterium]
MPRAKYNWSDFSNHVLVETARSLKLLIVLASIFTYLRLGLFFSHIYLWNNRTFSGLWILFRHGFLFDLKVVSVATLPVFIIPPLVFLWYGSDCGKFWPARRRAYGYLLIVIAVSLSLVDFAYFKEYKDQFNWWVLNFLFDDKVAILKTIWIDYPIIRMLLAAILISKIFCHFYNKWDRMECVWVKKLSRANAWCNWVAIGVFLLGFLFALRGTFGRRPLQMLDVAITGDPFLNKLVINPAYALYYLLFRNYDRRSFEERIKDNLSEVRLRESIRFLFGDEVDTDDIDAILERQASGFQLNPKPKHLFVLVAESMDSWPFLDKYRYLDLVNDLRDVAEKGLFVWSFLPAADMTINAISSQICNFPYARLYFNHMPECQKEFPYSVGSIFSRLGYETSFFYGGYMSWQNINNFVPINGFKNVYGGDVMGELTGKEWGVDDDGLFDFVLEKIPSDVPTFSLILNTSNHPPYEIDVDSKGVPVKAISAVTSDSSKIKQLRHIWYANNCIANFVKKADEKFENCLFLITGDHFSRRHLYNEHSFYESSCVPLIIYGKNYLDQLAVDFVPVGSHVDIPPTMVELCADSGFTYHSFGKNILDRNSIKEGYGYAAVVFSDGICDLATRTLHGIPYRPLGSHSDEEIRDAIKRQNAWMELSQWRVLFGSRLADPSTKN